MSREDRAKLGLGVPGVSGATGKRLIVRPEKRPDRMGSNEVFRCMDRLLAGDVDVGSAREILWESHRGSVHVKMQGLVPLPDPTPGCCAGGVIATLAWWCFWLLRRGLFRH